MSTRQLSMNEYLQAAIGAVAHDESGQVGPTCKSLRDGDEHPIGIAVTTVEDQEFGAGATDRLFPLQSVAKSFVYAMALQDCGFEEVATVVDIEPSGESYDRISVEESTNRPDNPMINAGAMTVHGLICGPNADAKEREERILDVFSALAGRRLAIDDEVYDLESEASHRNLAIAHMLRALDVLPDDPEDIAMGYVRQCAITTTCADLALMGATLANSGTNPRTGEEVFSPAVVRQTLSVMMTCGMYDAAGDWVSEVGVPAKSGVGGGILGVIPGRGAVATFSPRLDEHGTSVRGQLAFEWLSDRLGIHFVDALHEEDHRWERAVHA